jgi:beta-ureidopropionase / N-carbamoyl-L-amino-acid hydrolase
MRTDLPLPEQAWLHDEIESLAEIREPDAPGWTRRALSEVETAGRQEVERRMRAAGLDVHVDGAGNLVGVLEGRDGGSALVTGSHTDTVLGGGRFDGIIGVLGALESLRCLAEAGVRLRHDLWVVDFYGEEPNEFGLSCLGSRAVAGNLSRVHLDRADQSGRRLGEAMAAVGIDPDRALSANWNPKDLAAFVECHIEQGPRLEEEGIEIGVVSAIAGIDRATVNLQGRRDHAGTMPVALRHDAACAAAEVVLAVERLGRDGGVGTTGRVVVEPGAANIVPDHALLWVEFRSIEETWLERTRQQLEGAVAEAGDRRGVLGDVEWTSAEAPTVMSDLVARAVEDAAGALGRSVLRLPSGAGHDSAQLASLTPTGMLFVPSAGGRSHCPEEFTDAADVAVGAQVLAATLAHLDEITT